jgi:hypothetical protein
MSSAGVHTAGEGHGWNVRWFDKVWRVGDAAEIWGEWPGVAKVRRRLALFLEGQPFGCPKCSRSYTCSLLHRRLFCKNQASRVCPQVQLANKVEASHYISYTLPPSQFCNTSDKHSHWNEPSNVLSLKRTLKHAVIKTKPQTCCHPNETSTVLSLKRTLKRAVIKTKPHTCCH